ncbi:uncharacterized protein BO80DRAFT_421954 [Aspergillus ibericus CBS 121593]|uniref:NmrA-like domain-containing protein n=1 Tax=Aspergillus ibericus CBS 121593 TaxID=1448316 RepID=A0A395H9R6_9EURO|nr:hypothetical protein BO80DRAFT_421954 [Aspergillus ibericus CBS 121593]RAL04701.1 hypothetical protein BO80DRAFT_421954 [Aspergillus ibericus CBS 121593]
MQPNPPPPSPPSSYSSVVMTGKHETFPAWGSDYPLAWYWTNKAQIETMVRDAGFQYWTILRPAFLMNNYLLPTASSMFPELVAGESTTRSAFVTAYRPDTKLTVVDPGDVGRFAAAAISDPRRFHAREIVRELSLASGREIALEFDEREEAERRAARDPRIWAQLWANEVGYQVDLDELRKVWD